MTDWWMGWMMGAGVAGGVGFVFAGAVGCGFVPLDDPGYVAENLAVAGGWGWEGLKAAWTGNVAGYWAPLLWMSLGLDTEVWSGAAWGYHLTNVLLHAANAGLLFMLLRRWLGKERAWLALAVALLWGLHPARVESVAWVTERKDVLGGLLGLATLWAYTGGRRGWALTALSAGMLVKPGMLVTLPFLLVLLEAWPMERVNWRAGELARVVARNGWFWAVGLGLGAVAWWANRAAGIVRTDMPGAWARIREVPMNYAAYLREVTWPAGMPLMGPWEASGAWAVAGAAALLAALTAGAARAASRWGRDGAGVLVGWLWFLGMLVPSIGLVWMGTTTGTGDRFAYLPHVGLFLAGGLCADRWLAGRWVRWAGLAMALVLAAAWGEISVVRMGAWRTEEAFCRRLIAQWEGNAFAHGTLGAALAREGASRRGEAVAELRRAAELDGSDVRVLNNLAWVLGMGEGATEAERREAVAWAERALAEVGQQEAAGRMLPAGTRTAVEDTLAQARARADESRGF